MMLQLMAQPPARPDGDPLVAYFRGLRLPRGTAYRAIMKSSSARPRSCARPRSSVRQDLFAAPLGIRWSPGWFDYALRCRALLGAEPSAGPRRPTIFFGGFPISRRRPSTLASGAGHLRLRIQGFAAHSVARGPCLFSRCGRSSAQARSWAFRGHAIEVRALIHRPPPRRIPPHGESFAVASRSSHRHLRRLLDAGTDRPRHPAPSRSGGDRWAGWRIPTRRPWSTRERHWPPLGPAGSDYAGRLLIYRKPIFWPPAGSRRRARSTRWLEGPRAALHLRRRTGIAGICWNGRSAAPPSHDLQCS